MNGTGMTQVVETEHYQRIYIRRILWNFIFSPLFWFGLVQGFFEWEFIIQAIYANTDKISGFCFGQETEI